MNQSLEILTVSSRYIRIYLYLRIIQSGLNFNLNLLITVPPPNCLKTLKHVYIDMDKSFCDYTRAKFIKLKWFRVNAFPGILEFPRTTFVPSKRKYFETKWNKMRVILVNLVKKYLVSKICRIPAVSIFVNLRAISLYYSKWSCNHAETRWCREAVRYFEREETGFLFLTYALGNNFLWNVDRAVSYYT